VREGNAGEGGHRKGEGGKRGKRGGGEGRGRGKSVGGMGGRRRSFNIGIERNGYKVLIEQKRRTEVWVNQ
jgi:hypothetical protein